MRLWTVQHHHAVPALEEAGRLVGDWQRVSPTWRSAYELMVGEMRQRGIDCAGRPPMWAWAGPDTRDERVTVTVELLLSLHEWEQGVVVLDLDVPDELVLLSSYSGWNDLLEAVLTGAASPVMDWSVGPDDLHDPVQCGVQACLPFIHPSWVRGIRPIERPADEAEEAETAEAEEAEDVTEAPAAPRAE
ncbi:DUF3841 domain-containing protein [Streptomyces sp. bgisy100]|uniref:DUF3841 domain-containing protein n=1 Tax=Streptomyces sp. bgisy100 TaxID=3413783 RepID=UPI003D7395F5